MTNREAIAATILPYSVDENGLEKVFLDSAEHFGVEAGIDDTYVAATMKQTVALAAMYCLARMKVLSSEKVDVISNTYDTKKLDQAIASIAASADLSPSLVASEDDNYGLTAKKCW